MGSSGIPTQANSSKASVTDFFSFQDLSHNELREVPENLEKAVYLTVLNLSYNKIESIPQHLFLNLVDLIYLDISGNELGKQV